MSRTEEKVRPPFDDKECKVPLPTRLPLDTGTAGRGTHPCPFPSLRGLWCGDRCGLRRRQELSEKSQGGRHYRNDRGRSRPLATK